MIPHLLARMAAADDGAAAEVIPGKVFISDADADAYELNLESLLSVRPPAFLDAMKERPHFDNLRCSRQDNSSAAYNAPLVVFGDDLYRMKCAEHVWGRWSEKNKCKFNDYSKNRFLMGKDFDLLKKCPVLSVVESRALFDKLMEKFRV